MRLAPPLAFFVAFALAGTLASKDDLESGAMGIAKDRASVGAHFVSNSNAKDSTDAIIADSLVWGDFQPGASEAFYLELGDKTTGYGKVVFQQDNSARGVVTCFFADTPLELMRHRVTLQKGTKPFDADDGLPAKGDSEPRGIELWGFTEYGDKKPYLQVCSFTRAQDLDWAQLATQPDFFRKRGFTWKIELTHPMLMELPDAPKIVTDPVRPVTATLKPCASDGDCFLPQIRLFVKEVEDHDRVLFYTWSSEVELKRKLAPESGFPKEVVADVNKAFYWNVGNPQNGTGIVTVHPLDDGSGSLSCFLAHQIDKANGGFLGAFVFNETRTDVDLSWVSTFETMDAQTKVRTTHCSWIPSTLFSTEKIKSLASGWNWVMVDNTGSALGRGKWTTGPEPCSSRSDSLCDLSEAQLHRCSYQQNGDLPLCPVELGPKISLPTRFVGDASDAFFVEVGDHVKGKVVFQKDERNAAIVTCFAPNGPASAPGNTTVHLMGRKLPDTKIYSDVDTTASYSVLSDDRALQDCSLSAYTEPAWKALLSAEWEHMAWNVTLTADHQARISTVGEPSAKMDCAEASDGGCKLLDFVGCVSEDLDSEDHDLNHCTFEGKAAANAAM